MVKKITKYLKFAVCCALILSLIAPSYAALSASDGSAFVTKAEFDSALADFNSRLTTFEAGINSKIDSQVTSYLDRNGIWNGAQQEFWAWWDDPDVGTFYRNLCFRNDPEKTFTAGGPNFTNWSPFVWQGGNNVFPIIKNVSKSGLLFLQFPYTKLSNIYLQPHGGTSEMSVLAANASFCSFFQVADWTSALRFNTIERWRNESHYTEPLEGEPFDAVKWESSINSVSQNNFAAGFNDYPTSISTPHRSDGLGCLFFNYLNSHGSSSSTNLPTGAGVMNFMLNSWCGIVSGTSTVGQSVMFQMESFPRTQNSNELKTNKYLFSPDSQIPVISREDGYGWETRRAAVSVSINYAEAKTFNSDTSFSNSDLIYTAFRTEHFRLMCNVQLFVSKGNTVLLQAGLGGFSYQYAGGPAGGGYRNQGFYPSAWIY